MLQYLRANLAFFNLLTSLVEHRVYCDKSPGGVVAMIPQSFPLLPTLLIHSDKTLLSLIRQLCSPAGLAGKKMTESLDSVHLTYEQDYSG